MALGLPLSTATHKLMALGITNTVSELIEATLTAQYERLSLTHAGRAILQQVGISPTRMTPNYADLTPEYGRSLYIPPIPKRMHPEHHAERWADRARQFEKRFSGRPDVTYTDASYHPSKPAMVAGALAPHRSWYTACSIRKTETVTAAQAVAIALAPADPVTKVVISDSQQAIRNYDASRISCQALHVLRSSPPPSTSRVLLWAPAHECRSVETPRCTHSLEIAAAEPSAGYTAPLPLTQACRTIPSSPHTRTSSNTIDSEDAYTLLHTAI
ncbi:hypothetical protein HPB50_002001 [Hyalomma asiaticum]|uniref:Uncharacterized protein n=1 Tax=Hyalomma asiaticum TaxID=266040 RepID=A0ACB7RYQ5_HYAAI|nr:hypothetical protein HPB50_002001 [Hyalomma asiaticum]